MLTIETEKRGDVDVVRPVGNIDTGTAFDFENRIVEMLDDGSRFFVIDFSEVDQLTSSGIRVLLMLAKKLDGLDGKLKLCSLTDHVRTVLEISGLSAQFEVAENVERAAAGFGSRPVVGPSRLTSLVSRLVVEPGTMAPSRDHGEPSPLTRHVADLLGRD